MVLGPDGASMADDIEPHLEDLGLPTGDRHDRPRSDHAFADGSHYKIEFLPEDIGEYRRLFDAADDHGVTVNRVTDTSGTVFASDERIREKCRLCRENDAELLLAPGLGERNDTSQQKSVGGMPMGTTRGMDALRDTVEEAQRIADLGCRGFVLFDPGVYTVCARLREAGDLPADTTIKLSSLLAVANAGTLAFWDERMAPRDSLNPVRDLTVPMLAAMRSVTARPLDIHAFWKDHVARTFDAPEIARVAAPVYLKNYRPGIDLEERLLHSASAVREIERTHPDLDQSPAGGDDLGIPAEP